MIAVRRFQAVSNVRAWRRLVAAPMALAISAASLAIAYWPSVAEALQFDRGALAAGEWWRALTAHLTHWNGEHLFWDAAMFLILGAVLEVRNRRQFILVVLAASVAISAAVWFLQPELTTYRGLSGLDTALFAMLAAGLLRDSSRNQDHSRRAVLAPALLLIGLAAKLTAELLTGRVFFVNADAAGFVPVPLAHLVGAAVGLLVPLLAFRPERCEGITSP
jgi:rhomboid family GlyGly-CTERM serine protease